LEINIDKFHSKRNVPVFLQAQKIIEEKEPIFSLEEVKEVLNELDKYESQIRTLRQGVFKKTYQRLNRFLAQNPEKITENYTKKGRVGK
jgi:hypothetical protein